MIGLYSFKKIGCRAFACLLLLMALSTSAFAQMNGNYTINRLSPASANNFVNFTSFVNALRGVARTDGGTNYTGGVTGPVSVSVSNGPYTEQITIPAITNASLTNSITVNGNSQVLEFNTSSAASKGVLTMDGADFFRFRNLTVRNNVANSMGFCVQFRNRADNNLFQNCTFEFSSITVGTTSTTTGQAYVVFSSVNNSLTLSSVRGDNGFSDTIRGCLMRTTNSNSPGPTFGTFEVQGTSYTSTPYNNTFENNTIQNFFQFGMYHYFTNGTWLLNNDISRANTTVNCNTAYYGIYAYYVYANTRGPRINSNWIHDLPYVNYNNVGSGVNNSYPIWSYWVYGGTSPATRGTINSNRMERLYCSSTFWGVYQYYNYYMDFNSNTMLSCFNNASTFYGMYGWYNYFVNYNNNSFINNTANSGSIYAIWQYYTTDGLFDGNRITGNRTVNSGYVYGLYIFYPYTRLHMVNNLHANNNGFTGQMAFYLYSGATGNWAVDNNTADMPIAPGSTFNYLYGIYTGSYGSPMNIRNNIVRMSSNAYYKYPIYSYGNQASYGAVDYNGYFLSGTTSFTMYYLGTQQAANFNAWTQLNGVGQNEVFGDPRFANAGAGDFRPRSFAYLNSGLAVNTNTRDINLSNRNSFIYDRGCAENFVDLSLNTTNYSGGNNVCGNYSERITLNFTNLFEDTARNFWVGFALNGNKVRERVSAATVSNGNGSYTFNVPVRFNRPGTNRLQVFLDIPDDNRSNDTISYQVNVTPSPFGGRLNFVPQSGINAAIDQPNFDVVMQGRPVTYELTPPVKYTNADYGSAWTATPTAVTAGGTVISGSISFSGAAGTTNARITFTAPNMFVDSTIWINARVNDANTGCDTLIRTRLLIAPQPTANFKFPAILCAGDGVVFDNLSTIRSGSFDSKWSFGDGDSAEGTNPVHYYDTYGTFKVTLTNKSLPWGFVKDTQLTVKVNEIPTVGFTKTNSCEGKAVTFTNTTSMVSPGTIAYNWTFGDKNTSALRNPSHTYSKPGAYMVTLTATSNGCSNAISKFAYQFATPKAAFTAANKKCDNEHVTFTNNSTITNGLMGYFWDFNDNDVVSTDQNPVHMFSTHGMKTVKLRAVSEFGCSDSVEKVNIEVLESPKAGFSNSAACSVDPTVFSNNTPNVTGWNNSFTWNFGDGSPASNVKSPTHAWTELGTKVVTLSVSTDNGCKDQITKTLNVGVQPVASFDVKDVCAGKPAVFQNLTSWPQGTINYNWDFNDGTTSNDAAPTHIYNNTSTKTYNVTLVAGVTGGCTDTMTKTFTVNENPKTCDFDWTWDYTKGLNAVSFNPIGGGLNGPQSGVSYTWVFDREGNSNAAQPWINFQLRGTYSITMSAKNAAGCECSVTKVINANTGIAKDGFGDDVNVFPNPTNGKFFVSVNTANSDKLSIELFNTVGGLVKTISTNGQFSGTFEVAADDLANGIYLVKISAGNKQTVRKIQVNR